MFSMKKALSAILITSLSLVSLISCGGTSETSSSEISSLEISSSAVSSQTPSAAPSSSQVAESSAAPVQSTEPASVAPPASSSAVVATNESPDKPDYILGLITDGQMKVQQQSASNEPNTVIDISDEATQEKIKGFISGLVPYSGELTNPVMGANAYYVNIRENGQEKVYCFTANELSDGSYIAINYQDSDPMANYSAPSDSYQTLSNLFV